MKPYEIINTYSVFTPIGEVHSIGAPEDLYLGDMVGFSDDDQGMVVGVVGNKQPTFVQSLKRVQIVLVRSPEIISTEHGSICKYNHTLAIPTACWVDGSAIYFPSDFNEAKEWLRKAWTAKFFDKVGEL